LGSDFRVPDPFYVMADQHRPCNRRKKGQRPVEERGQFSLFQFSFEIEHVGKRLDGVVSRALLAMSSTGEVRADSVLATGPVQADISGNRREPWPVSTGILTICCVNEPVRVLPRL
jgi:hypothetical protein